MWVHLSHLPTLSELRHGPECGPSMENGADGNEYFRIRYSPAKSERLGGGGGGCSSGPLDSCFCLVFHMGRVSN